MKTHSPDGEKRPGPDESPKALLAQILRDLADDPSDLGALLRGLALALQVASAECSHHAAGLGPRGAGSLPIEGYLGRVDPAPAVPSPARLKVIPLYSAGKPFSVLEFSSVRAPPPEPAYCTPREEDGHNLLYSEGRNHCT